MSDQLKTAKDNIRFAISKAKTDNSRLNCPKAKSFTEEFIKGATESYKIAERKTK